MPLPTAHSSRLFVACLCAEWCGACRDYRAAFEAQAALEGAAGGHDGPRYLWIDIEDHAEVLGDIDVETFPTLLIGDEQGRVFFHGSVTPHARTLERLVASATAGELGLIDDPELTALAVRARAFAPAS